MFRKYRAHQPSEVNLVKNVGDLKLMSGKRIAMRKNGTVWVWCQMESKSSSDDGLAIFRPFSRAAHDPVAWSPILK